MRVEQIGNATLYLGDCREVLPSLGTVDAVVTDPPYGIGYVTERRHVSEPPPPIEGDDEPALWCVPMLARVLCDGGALYLCTRIDVAPEWMAAVREAGLILKTPVVWDKGNHTAGDLEGDYGAQTEMVLFAHKGRHLLRRREPNLWRHMRPPPGAHPTPKPWQLMARAIRNSTDANNLVLDAFMGEGPTGVACARAGRRFVGIEKVPAHFATACQRIRDAYAQTDMFIDGASA